MQAKEMFNKKFERLVSRGLLDAVQLEAVYSKAGQEEVLPEEILIRTGVPRHEVLFCLAEYYGCPFTEYEENIVVSRNVVRLVEIQRLKKALWLPLSVREGWAEVIASQPDDPLVLEDIKRTLHVGKIDFIVALPSDLVRIIENNQDLNPSFPPSGGRTPLALVRTFLAERRSLMASTRTALAKGRTGLAFIRTGVSFITISLVLFRIFGFSPLMVFEAILLSLGVFMTIDGLRWYLPVRRAAAALHECGATEPTSGTTVLEVKNPGDYPVFVRTMPVKGADALRAGWSSLSPVMRRRFLASDRTDYAEERTLLACYRTAMARSRTGLAFTRTGIAFMGLGIALIRQFKPGPWLVFDSLLLLTGILMAGEGFYWYIPGRTAGKKGIAAVKKMIEEGNIWDFVIPTASNMSDRCSPNAAAILKTQCSPGIWATTGLALERTVLAERRNLMARLRTVMARSRTGMAFIRTGMSVASVGIGLLVYFGAANMLWTAFDLILIVAGFLLIADGFYWHVPAEHFRKELPYCFGDMEITMPDYGKPVREWKKAVFSHDDI